MNKEALKGLAMQALNMAKTDLRNERWRGFLLATCHAGEQIHRMSKVEQLINEKLGRDWLNDGAAKDAVFGLLRVVTGISPPDAVILVTVCNRFEQTAKFNALPSEEKERLIEQGHDGHHEMVREGLFTVHDALSATAQTPELVCLCFQKITPKGLFIGPPEIRVMPQEHFDGRLKMYGEGKHTAPAPNFASKTGAVN